MRTQRLTKGFLLEDQEDSISQFPVLHEVVDIVQQFKTLGPRAVVAD